MKQAWQISVSLVLTAPALVAQSAVPAEGDIRGIRGPVEIPQPADWQPWLLGGLLVACAAIAGWMIVRWMKRRNEHRVITAREAALEALGHARGLMAPATSRDYAFAVSDTLRAFMEERFSLPSTRQTTEEFLRSITDGPANELGAYAPSLSDFMRFCDLGKFSKWKLDRLAMEAMHTCALSVVNTELGSAQPQEPGGERAVSIQGAPPRQTLKHANPDAVPTAVL